jgi:hypothetical protein
MKTQKLLTVYPVVDKDVSRLGFKFMIHRVENEAKSTTYFKDKPKAVKMLKLFKNPPPPVVEEA